MNLEKLTVEDLMSVALIVAHPGDSVRRARVQMHDSDVRHLPVVDEKHQVVGIVSDRDLLRPRRTDRPLRIRDVMTRRVHSMTAGEPAHAAAELMLEHRIHALPVVDADGRLVGIITETDFLRAWVRSRAQRLDRSDPEPALTYPGLPDAG